MKVELSKIEEVNLREVWEHEAQNFTPWLSENLDQLSEELGLDLELRDQEAPVGGFSLDILAHDLGSSRPVIIENQLEGTDHDHLGKLLTYASGYDANVVVWIAREFRDEHRQVMDWLNQRTDDNTEFFGVVVELWKIDDSRPAVNFNLVSAPNEWRKENVSSGKGQNVGTSEKSERYRIFFQSLIDTLRDTHKFTRARKGQALNYYNFSAGGHQGISYGGSFPPGKVRVQVYINRDRDWNKSLFDKLANQRTAIELELDESLEWERLDDGKASRISIVRDGSIDNDDETLEEIQEWMIDHLRKFKEVFGSRLDELT